MNDKELDKGNNTDTIANWPLASMSGRQEGVVETGEMGSEDRWLLISS